MRILVLGGTQFLGLHIVEAMLAAGHTVTVLNRGHSPDRLPGNVERLRADRDEGPAGLGCLSGRSWDACVDVCGYTPRQVRASAGKLRDSIGRYIFISAVSVYGDPPHGPVHESAPRMAPAGEHVTEIDADTYGPLKVTCENIVGELYGDRHTLLRPQVVAGPHDPITRYAHWVGRAAMGGEMVAPGDGSDHVQVIDVRDLAQFTRTAIEGDLAGAFNLSGPRLTWAGFMSLLGARNLVWVPAPTLASAGLAFNELPLFRPDGGPRSSLMNVSNEKAIRAGLRLTEPAETVAATRAWLRTTDFVPALSPEIEAKVIDLFRRGGDWSHS